MAKKSKVVRIEDLTWTPAAWEQMLADADRASEDYARRWPRVTAVRYDRTTKLVVLDLSNGAQLAVPADKLQGVAAASEAARSDVKIGLNEVALGLQFPPKVLSMVRARVPPGSVDRVLLEAGLYAPAVAKALGLIDLVEDDVLTAARAHLQRLAAHPREAYVSTKRALRGSVLEVDEESLRHFRDVLIPLWASDAVKARVAQVLKR